MAKKNPWQNEIELAQEICAVFDCSVTASSHAYEIAVIQGEGVQLLLYPHKTSAGHHHARVRDNGSKDKLKGRRLMAALHDGEGLPQPIADRVKYSCTFSWKGMSMSDPALARAAADRASSPSPQDGGGA